MYSLQPPCPHMMQTMAMQLKIDIYVQLMFIPVLVVSQVQVAGAAASAEVVCSAEY